MSAYFQFCLISLLPLLAIVAAAKDISSYIIPNWISLGLMAAFFMLAATAGVTLPVLGSHLLVGVVALLIGMGLFALGWIGGGDAKLLAACCLWFGWPDSEAFLLDTALAGGAFAFVLLVMRGQLARPIVGVRSGWIGRLVTPGEPAPYGVAIAVGALIAFPASSLIRFVHISY